MNDQINFQLSQLSRLFKEAPKMNFDKCHLVIFGDYANEDSIKHLILVAVENKQLSLAIRLTKELEKLSKQ